LSRLLLGHELQPDRDAGQLLELLVVLLQELAARILDEIRLDALSLVALPVEGRLRVRERPCECGGSAGGELQEAAAGDTGIHERSSFGLLGDTHPRLRGTLRDPAPHGLGAREDLAETGGETQ